jgi:hypothetical protein
MQPLNELERYEEKLVSLWERSVTTLGMHTVHVLLDRAIWQTAQRHPDIALIQHDNSRLSFDALGESYVTRPQEEIAAAFDDLSAEMLRILARLRVFVRFDESGCLPGSEATPAKVARVDPDDFPPSTLPTSIPGAGTVPSPDQRRAGVLLVQLGAETLAIGAPCVLANEYACRIS